MSRLLVTLAFCALSAQGVDLTPATYEAATAGKTVFIKFFAPWCGHCKKLKHAGGVPSPPDWDKLIEEYKSHPTKLIGDVDCTGEGKPLCEANGVKGFPTLLYGPPEDLQKYEGARALGALQKFAEEKLVPMCSPKNVDLCDDAKKAEIKKYQDMAPDALKTLIEGAETELKDVEADFKTNVEALQKQYETFVKNKDDKLAKLKEAGLGLMKSVLASTVGDAKKEEL